MNSPELRSFLKDKPQGELVEALADIYERLCCDENGQYDPAESVAADSAADFVESVNLSFANLGVETPYVDESEDDGEQRGVKPDGTDYGAWERNGDIEDWVSRTLERIRAGVYTNTAELVDEMREFLSDISGATDTVVKEHVAGEFGEAMEAVGLKPFGEDGEGSSIYGW